MYLRSVLLVIVAVASAAAQQKPGFGDSDQIVIKHMYDRYAQAFMKRDFVALREFVQAPFVVSAGGELQTFASVDAVVERYRKLLEALQRRNYDRSEITAMRVTPLTADTAIINASYRRFKKDGSVLEEGAGVYPVCKSSGAWKLCGVMGQDPKYFGQVFGR